MHTQLEYRMNALASLFMANLPFPLSETLQGGEGLKHFSRLIVCCIVLVLCKEAGIAQTPHTALLQENILTAKHGLTSRELTATVQDKYGFLWLGTRNGLFCWDGVQMTAFLAQSADSTALPSNAVLHLHEDRRGTLWVATDAGLARLWRHNNTFSTVLAGKPVTDLHEDSRGQLWCWVHTPTVKADEICLYDPQTGMETCFREGEHGLRSAYLYAFAETKDGMVWFGTTNGLHRFDRKKGVFTAFLTDALAAQSPATSQEAHILSLVVDANGMLLVGTGKGLLRGTTPANDQFTPFLGANSTPLLRESAILLLQKDSKGAVFTGAMRRETNTNAANTLTWIHLQNGTMSNTVPAIPLEGKAQSHRATFDVGGNLWWGAANGAIVLQPSTMQVTVRFSESLSENRITTPVTAITAARSGAVWIARLNGGVSAVLPPRQPFGTLPNLLSQNVSALGESPDGAVWVGYMGGAGVSRFNRATSTMTHFRQDPANPASIGGFNGETNIYAFHADKSGTWRVGSYFLERFTGSGFRHTPLLNNALAPATAIADDKQGSANIWVGSTFGLLITDADGKVLQRYTHNPKNDATLGNNNIHVLLRDRSNTLWIGHDGGVDRLNADGQRFTRLNAAPNQTFGAVTAFAEDAKGRVWIGARNGAFCFDPATQAVVRHLTQTDGLWENAVAGLCIDKRGNVWMSSRRGLCRYNPATQVLTRFSATDGIADEEFSDGAALCTKDGTLWFGARTAVVVVHPDSIQARSKPSPAILTGLKKFGERATLDSYIADAASIDLRYEDKVISFEYAVPGALYADKIQYSYKLDGLDTAWSKVENEREAKYTALPSGEYTFFVRASDENGVWQETPTSVRVVVHPPWWRAWWFLTGSSLFLVVGGFFAYKQRIRVIEARNRELAGIVDERTQQLKEANIEVHRQMEILNEQSKDIEIANSRLQEANLQLDTALSELKTTQTQLVQSERINAAGMLTAGVMHEINNPNASIHSALELAQQRLSSMKEYFLSLLDDEGRTSPEAKRFVEMLAQTGDILNVALTGSDRILNIVIALQGFTKHQQQGRVDNTVQAELHSTAMMFRYQFKDVEVEEAISPELRINAEWSEINQAMLNLFVNAAQAGATQIRLSADTSDDGAWLHLHITDNGGGMTEETQKRLFEPFYTTKCAGNSGLGLSITRQIIERHGGTIRVESERAKGTTFTVSLPRDAKKRERND